MLPCLLFGASIVVYDNSPVCRTLLVDCARDWGRKGGAAAAAAAEARGTRQDAKNQKENIIAETGELAQSHHSLCSWRAQSKCTNAWNRGALSSAKASLGVTSDISAAGLTSFGDVGRLIELMPRPLAQYLKGSAIVRATAAGLGCTIHDRLRIKAAAALRGDSNIP